MKHITKDFNQKQTLPDAFNFYFKGMVLGVLDIETTGLSANRNEFILGGLLLIPPDGPCKSHQFFAQTPDEEQETLKAFLTEVEKADMLLTYNGKHFDLPFLQQRGATFDPQLPYNFDLYPVLKGYSPLRKFLPNLKQKTVENFMGFWTSRKDEISGKESVTLYYEYVTTKDPKIEETILLHNYDDICQLYRLLDTLGKCDLHKALYFIGFPAILSSASKPGLYVEKIKLTGNYMDITGIQKGTPIDYRVFEQEGLPCTVLFDSQQATFHIRVPLLQSSGMILSDLRVLGLHSRSFDQYPTYGDGLLLLKQQDNENYLEINHLVKMLLERIMEQWITRQ